MPPGRSDFDFDAVVLGGGPAGSAAAIELARGGLSVALLERTRPAGPRVGDTLSPDAAASLHGLGVWDLFEQVPRIASPGVVSLWGTAACREHSFVFNPYGHGWHVDRARFDEMLARGAARAGARVFLGASPRSIRPADGIGWHLSIESGAGRETLSCRWLVDATGRNGWFVRRQGLRARPLDRLVAVFARVEPVASADSRLFLEATPAGWWYFAALPCPGTGPRAIAAFLTDHDLLPRRPGARAQHWRAELARTRLIAGLVGEATVPEEDPRVVAAHATWLGRVAGPRWLAVGDAAMAHDPLSGAGIRAALESGRHAASAVISESRGAESERDAARRHQAWAQANRRAYREGHEEYYRSVTRWPGAIFWRRRAIVANP